MRQFSDSFVYICPSLSLLASLLCHFDSLLVCLTNYYVWIWMTYPCKTTENIFHCLRVNIIKLNDEYNFSVSLSLVMLKD